MLHLDGNLSIVELNNFNTFSRVFNNLYEHNNWFISISTWNQYKAVMFAYVAAGASWTQRPLTFAHRGIGFSSHCSCAANFTPDKTLHIFETGLFKGCNLPKMLLSKYKFKQTFPRFKSPVLKPISPKQRGGCCLWFISYTPGRYNKVQVG